MTAPEQHEHATYRVDWVFMIGTMGDSEGRTWAKELVEEKRFATKARAEAYRDSHPDLELGQGGSWKTKNCYGQFAIVRQEVPIDILALPEVKALVEAASQLSHTVDSAFYTEGRVGYETVEQMREVHAKEREVAIQTYVGARDAEEALAMSHRSSRSVIRGAKARINDMLTDLNTALIAINNKV